MPLFGVWEMIEMDIFIMAKSSFSCIAALINGGIEICEPTGFPLFPTR
jgi:hypothetical protein